MHFEYKVEIVDLAYDCGCMLRSRQILAHRTLAAHHSAMTTAVTAALQL